MPALDIVIRGMNCDHCVAAVRKELSRLPGVVVRDVHIGTASVTYEPGKATREQIDAAIEEAGFTVVR